MATEIKNSSDRQPAAAESATKDFSLSQSPTINIGRVMPSEQNKTIFVGIAGGTASGKTTVAEEIFERVRVG